MNNYTKNIIAFIILLSSIAFSDVNAQESRVLTFDQYLENVKKSNIDYLVERYNVDIADANVKAAKIFPDPELSVSYTDNQNKRLQMGYGIDAELSYTLELGGKRRARIQLAQSEKDMTNALLEDFFRNLKADATIVFLEAIKQRELYEIQKRSYKQMVEMARADSIRFNLGIITETDARQSKLEVGMMLNDLYTAKGDLQEVLLRLLVFQGDKSMLLPDSVAGSLRYRIGEFDLSSLVVTAQNNRADLQAALKSREISQNNLRLARANRAIDLGLTLTGSYSSEVLNELAPAPAFKGVTAGVGIPLKFSNMNRGELRAAQLAVSQSEKQYEAIEMQICSEVMQAFSRYEITSLKVEQFDTGLLDDAQRIFEKKRYSYERGESAILEVLTAQQVYNEIQTNYIETLYEYAVAMIELERACGIEGL